MSEIQLKSSHVTVELRQIAKSSEGEPVWISRHTATALLSLIDAEPPDAWVAAVDRELIAAELGVADSGDSVEVASKKLRDLIDWHVSVATDPTVNGGFVMVPVEPTPGRLMSMALRADHGLGVPGYYDQEMFRGLGMATHQQKLDGAIREARKQYEEVVGAGYYAPEKEDGYAAMLDARPEVPNA